MLFIFGKASLFALLLGVALDFLLGDPHSPYHPICLIGRLISFSEKKYRKICPKTKNGEIIAGLLIVITVLLFSVGIPFLILKVAYGMNIHIGMIVEAFLCYTAIATKSLKDESMKVYHALKDEGLEAGRRAVSMIVGRDTKVLDEEGVTKAAVETIAENFSDGVVAPIMFMFFGGAVFGYLYKGINTMDSMIGYKNEKYLYVGRIAAKLDDIANFIPSRWAAMCMILASFIMGYNGRNAVTIYIRDRKNHASPNSAQTESVAAGALGLLLAGDAWYFGELHHKQTIGDELRKIEYEDIKRMNKLMYASTIVLIIPLIICCFFA